MAQFGSGPVLFHQFWHYLVKITKLTCWLRPWLSLDWFYNCGTSCVSNPSFYPRHPLPPHMTKPTISKNLYSLHIWYKKEKFQVSTDSTSFVPVKYSPASLYQSLHCQYPSTSGHILHSAQYLKLWQEAFQPVEDVHNLLTMTKKAPIWQWWPTTMKNTKIFLINRNALYHAAARGYYYSVIINIGGRSDEELRRLVGQVLVSALAVSMDKHAERMPNWLHCWGCWRCLPKLVFPEIWALSPYSNVDLFIEVFKLLWCPQTQTICEITLQHSKSNLWSSYSLLIYHSSPLESLWRYTLLCSLPACSTVSSLSPLSQVYSTIKTSGLLSLIALLCEVGLDSAFDDEQVKAYIMGCACCGELNICVDHTDSSILF